MADKSSLRRVIGALSRPRTIEELLHLTQLPERTLRYNLAILRRRGLIKEFYSFSDRRKKIIKLSKG